MPRNRVVAIIAMFSMFAFTLAACGGAVGKNDLNEAKEELKADNDGVEKICKDAETAAKTETAACIAKETACKASEAVCRQQPAATMLTKARCQRLMPAANATFTKCGTKMEAGTLSLDAANKMVPGLQDEDCVVNLTGLIADGQTPISKLHVTKWSDAGDKILEFWIEHTLGKISCLP